ncbi:MAG TPA: 16S rRNA (cytosine(1402)-N(4))-methyltransferase RsmH [Terriglobia bacterium]|nr:16S rRNA (cytosine(1402)-N(4))-methyltransferase RsmH [Terriglobia bacterium]
MSGGEKNIASIENNENEGSKIQNPKSKIVQNPESRIVHRPVMVREALEFLNVQPGGTYIDATVGGGGHAGAILERLGSDGRLLGIDRDPVGVSATRERLGRFGERLILVEGNFAAIDAVHAASGLPPAGGVLADLGMSSLQLDDASRGFSFNRAGPLDMRMDPQGETAEELVNTARERDLADLIFKLGEERHSRRIARAIVKARPIRTTTQLAQVVTRSIPSRAGLHQLHHIHPATRTFMALRMAVNREMENLEALLAKVLGVLAARGRLVIISFHSLEDRLVKQTFASWQREGRARVLTRKVVRASEDEVGENPRARSAKLRAAEKQESGFRP